MILTVEVCQHLIQSMRQSTRKCVEMDASKTNRLGPSKQDCTPAITEKYYQPPRTWGETNDKRKIGRQLWSEGTGAHTLVPSMF